MASVSYDGWITVPFGWNTPTDGGAITSTTVTIGNSAATNCVGCVLYATETMTVTNIAMCCTATAGTVTNKTIVGGVYTLDSVGSPNFTSGLVGSTGSALFSGATGIYDLSGISASITKGTRYWFGFTANNWATSNSATFRTSYTSTLTTSQQFEYPASGLTTAVTKSTGHPAVMYSNGTNWYGFHPLASPHQTLVSFTGTTNTEWGVSFQMPSGISYKIKSIVFHGHLPDNARSNSFELRLYDTDGTTILDSVAYDKRVARDSAAFAIGVRQYAFDACPVLQGGTKYYVVYSDSLDDVNDFRVANIGSTTYDSVFEGLVAKQVTRNARASGAFTETTTQIPQFTVFIDYFDTPSTGGLMVHPGMAGGLRG